MDTDTTQNKAEGDIMRQKGMTPASAPGSGTGWSPACERVADNHTSAYQYNESLHAELMKLNGLYCHKMYVCLIIRI